MTNSATPANSKRDVWLGVGLIVLLLFVIGKCAGKGKDNPSATAPSSVAVATATTAAVDLDTVVTLTGVVSQVDDHNEIYVDLDHGKRYRTKLAHVTDYVCSSMKSAFTQSLKAALAPGTRVTLVRMPRYSGSRRMSDESFIFVSSTTVTSVVATSTPTSSTAESTTSPAPSSTTGSTTSGAPATDQSVNEQIVALGSAGVDPVISRGAYAKSFVEEAAKAKKQAGAEAAPYIDALIGADASAWDEHVGAMGACRDEKEESDRKFYGPDMIPNTEDDPHYSSSSSNSGGSSGSSKFCRKHWYC